MASRVEKVITIAAGFSFIAAIALCDSAGLFPRQIARAKPNVAEATTASFDFNLSPTVRHVWESIFQKLSP